MSEALIREAGAEDLERAATLWTQLTEFHQEHGAELDSPAGAPKAWIESFERVLGRFAFAWVAEVDGEISGFVLARLKRAPAFLGASLTGEISNLFVTETLRRTRVGQRLVKTAVQKLKDAGAASVDVQVFEGNEPGWNFWRAQGFEPELRQLRLFLESEPAAAP